MIQLQRTLFSATNSVSVNAVSSSVLSTSSSSGLSHSMAKFQSRTLQNYTGKCIPVLPFAIACNYARCPQLTFRKGRGAVAIKAGCAKVGEYCVRDGSSSAFSAYSRLTMGFSQSVASSNAFSQQSLNNGSAFQLPNYRALGKKFFSQSTEALNGSDSKNVAHVRSGGNPVLFEGFDKKLKGTRAISASRGNRISGSGTSVSTGIDVRISSEQLVGDTKDADTCSSNSSSVSSSNSGSKGIKKKKPRSKIKKEEISSINAPEDVVAECKDGQSKSSDSSINDRNLAQDPKKELTGDTSKGSASTKQQSNKKRGKPGRKGGTARASNTLPDKQNIVGDGTGKLQGQMTLKQLYPPTGKSVMVVESVTKAKVIQNYLGDMFEVLPSHGHVRDLAARSGSVRPDDDFSMVWEVPSAAWTHLKSIKVTLNGAKNLILASDPDREGEAIAWHILEMLQQQDALHEGISIARVVFHEITEASIKSALQSPREIDANLVQAYLARRALDYLIGFNVSPLLWRKLPGCQSAGRVQSAALALICDREMEIDEFQPQEYWTVETELNKKDPHSSGEEFTIPAYLTHFDSKKINQLSISSDTEAKNIETVLKLATFQVLSSKKNKVRRNPPMPYITSTLQQDAANKYNFPATYTMKLAQKLYEGIQLADGNAAGLITYTRTDGLHISDEAVKDIRSLVIQRYGQNLVSESPRKYFKKVKNAQEAHEAIRPTDIRQLPSMLVEVLDEDSHKLYSLIWCRTMACQMEPSITEQIQIDSAHDCESIILRSTCSRVQFRGFQEVFKDPEAIAVKFNEPEENGRDELFRILNVLKPGDQLSLGAVELKQHFTQPPPRYSEGTLVKRMEELGIGRPSTYATTLKVLQGRNYVAVKSRVLYPEFRGRMVSAFLCHHFSEVTDYSFTADMETELDNVSAGLTDWKGLLRDYWTRFSTYCERANSVHIHQVEKMLEKKFGDFLFSFLPDNIRTCPSCLEGTLIFKVSRFGAGYFIGCDQHPKCKYIAKTLYSEDEEEVTPQNNSVEEPKSLGLHPVSNEKILLKSGPYGFYVQLGEDRKGYLPKRASVSQIKDVDSITLEDALELLRYPITLGNHPKDGQPVILKIAKAGFSVRHRRTIAPVPKNLKPRAITLEKALELLSGKDVKRCGRPKNKPKVEEAVEAM